MNCVHCQISRTSPLWFGEIFNTSQQDKKTAVAAPVSRKIWLLVCAGKARQAIDPAPDSSIAIH
jgi:hypothetical protein